MEGAQKIIMKVLLIGHGCGPWQGSEPGVTWNWSCALSALHDVTVVTHPRHRDDIEKFLADQPNPRLRFEFVSVPKAIDPWKQWNTNKGVKLNYVLWLHFAIKAARKLCERETFDLAHQVSWTAVNGGAKMYKLPIPYVWGPVGGGMTAPEGFYDYFGNEARSEKIRTLRVKLTPYSPSLRKLIQHSSLLLAANYETADLLKQAGAGEVPMFRDPSVPQESFPATIAPGSGGPDLQILWAGRLTGRKALSLGLEALARVKELPFRLRVVGKGPQRAPMEAKARELGIAEKVTFIGGVPKPEMDALFQSSDAFLFTSLRDSGGTVLMEAMSHGVPVLTLDHHGAGFMVTDEAGIKVPVTTPEEVVAGLAEAVRTLVASPEKRAAMGRAGRALIEDESPERRAQRMTEYYEQALERHRAQTAR